MNLGEGYVEKSLSPFGQLANRLKVASSNSFTKMFLSLFLSFCSLCLNYFQAQAENGTFIYWALQNSKDNPVPGPL